MLKQFSLQQHVRDALMTMHNKEFKAKRIFL